MRIGWVLNLYKYMKIFTWLKGSINLLLVQIIRKILRPEFLTLELETNSSSTSKVLQRPWLNLPHDVLESIANHLGAIDLFSFRGTCKEWRSCAPSKVSPRHRHHHHHQAKSCTITNQEDHLWFLLYGEGGNPNCVLFDPCSKKLNRSINILELRKGVLCIASSGGWLLFHRRSNRSMFFFCPLSRVKIDLPKLPSYIVGERFWNIIASFSSPPTSPDCVVCVFSVVNCSPQANSVPHFKIVVNLLRRGANEWDHRLEYAYNGDHPWYEIGCTTFLDGSNIYIIDDMRNVAVFSLKERQWTYRRFEVGFVFTDLFDAEWKYFCLCKGLSKQKLGLKKYDSLSICGTVIQDSTKVGRKRCIFGEKYKGGDIDDWAGSLLSLLSSTISIAGNNDGISKVKNHKGVWFQPRFFQLPPNYSW